MFVVILYERLPNFCYMCGMVRHGATSCNRRPGSSLENQMMKEAIVGGNLPNISRSNPEGSHVRLVAARSTKALAQSKIDEANLAAEFGSWMLATRRRNKGRSRGGADFSSTRGSHLHQAGRDDAFQAVRSNCDEANPTVETDVQHSEGRRRVGGTLGGYRSRGRGCGGLSHHSSDHLSPSIPPNKDVPNLGTGGPPFSQALEETQLMESRDIQGPSKQDKKREESFN